MEPSNQTPRMPLTIYKRIVAVFLALTAGIALLVLYIVFSRAKVIVLVKRQDVAADALIDVVRQPAAADDIPGDVEQVVDSLSQTFPATSLANVDAHAEGQVKITSSYGHSQTLIATTRLVTPDGALFRIKKTVTVPANGSATVDAFADAAGAAGAVQSATFTIPGLNDSLRPLFAVTTVAPFAGGIKDVRMVTKDDADAAVEVLKEKLGVALAGRLRGQAKQSGLPMAGEIIQLDVTDQRTDAAVGTQADAFQMTVTVKATGVFYDKAKFDAAIAARLKEGIPAGRTLAAVDDSGLRRVERIDLAAGRANVRVRAKGTAALSDASPDLAAAKLAGVTADAATKYLESIDGVSSASVKVTPFWIDRMPNLAGHIAVEVR